ncbi:MAG: serine hydrolase domain-containing protein [Pseudomonadota bacterium]
MRAIVAALTLSLAGALTLTGCDAIKLYANLPKDKDVLFWTQDQRDNAFRALEKLATVRDIKAGGKVHPLPQGKPLEVGLDIDTYMRNQRTAGLIILQDGKIRLERYGLGYTAEGRWTSFSVAKSFTSTLVGAAIRDGKIKSLEDKVTQYIPGLRGSVYDDVTVRQLLTMTSGVKWNEDYADPKSDVALFGKQKAVKGEDITVSYMKTLKREAPPGTKWVYKTGETNLIGVLVSSATGRKLGEYLSDKVWKPYGMEADAFWILGDTGHEISGCCISARLRDYARFGQFVMEGGKGVVADDWFAQATTKQADIGQRGRGYGFQWWTNDDGSYAAQGIFGQGIFIDPKRRLVIATNGNWPKATDPETVGAERERFYDAVQAAIDAGR